MRTTLELQDALLRLAKRRAAEEDRTLTAVIEDALRQYLTPAPKAAPKYRFEPVTKRGRLLAGVDLADRDSLYERMDGRG